MCLQVKVINRLLAACSVKPEKCAVKIEKTIAFSRPETYLVGQAIESLHDLPTECIVYCVAIRKIQ